ncbi:inorganic diphosphatase [Nostoc sp. FACHB-888]|uniref:inorganic diphosphatase n=1 Tax=Nostoc sp. FACHB-888 TaxID=2692842 RepID=UPI0016834213|nr:inorganic diphosphatase [Nostoc sp. FACHB-888]MBD2246216.1 inorganic diphosphatase [Nostoc sp. FACHB-888]
MQIDIKEFLATQVTVIVDRPLGSRHPQHKYIYPINYGYIAGTLAPDGEEVDAYILGVFEPLSQFEGECIAIIRRIDDADDKLIVVPQGLNYGNEQIEALTEFQERFFVSVILRT